MVIPSYIATFLARHDDDGDNNVDDDGDDTLQLDEMQTFDESYVSCWIVGRNTFKLVKIYTSRWNRENKVKSSKLMH